MAAIATYGETRHTLVDRSATPARTCPATSPRESRSCARRGAPKRLFQAVDHCVGNVELGKMDEWVEFYNRVMGFTNMAEFIGDDIATDYSALMSQGRRQRQPPGEVPAQRAGRRARRSRRSTSTSSSTAAPACQHIALATNDILATVDAMRAPASSSSTPRTPTTTTPSCAPGSAHVRVPIEELQKRGSWSTATRTATCCRSSPSRSATGRRSSSS
jgi:4-hydroxyphenylpyruvate dioxygenase